MPFLLPLLLAAAPVQTATEALAEDAAIYAERYGVDPAQAFTRLRAQEESVAATDGIAARHRDRLAGLWLEHRPSLRIVVLLTGTDPVPPETIVAAGIAVPVEYRTGAYATHDRLIAALTEQQAAIRAALSGPPGLGVDPRTGTLIVATSDRLEREEANALATRFAAAADVPVAVRGWGEMGADMAATGGERVIGSAEGRRYVCTTGFTVTDGVRIGITTAAHCPDQLEHVAADGARTPLTMVGAWGAGHQDVQIHVPTDPVAERPLPLFHAVPEHARPLLSWRNRISTRTGDFVCHRGERSGTSCAEVAFPDYAPPGDLCAGPCPPLWVAVNGPDCRGGDSGGPVYLGAIAFGTLKGASRTGDGVCRLYYYMSTDYLPPGWGLVRYAGQPIPARPEPVEGPSFPNR